MVPWVSPLHYRMGVGLTRHWESSDQGREYLLELISLQLSVILDKCLPLPFGL
jgi:hypothetical protein